LIFQQIYTPSLGQKQTPLKVLSSQAGEATEGNNESKLTDLEAPHSAEIVSRRFSARLLAASRLFGFVLDKNKCKGCCSSADKWTAKQLS